MASLPQKIESKLLRDFRSLCKTYDYDPKSKLETLIKEFIKTNSKDSKKAKGK